MLLTAKEKSEQVPSHTNSAHKHVQAVQIETHKTICTNPAGTTIIMYGAKSKALKTDAQNSTMLCDTALPNLLQDSTRTSTELLSCSFCSVFLFSTRAWAEHCGYSHRQNSQSTTSVQNFRTMITAKPGHKAARHTNKGVPPTVHAAKIASVFPAAELSCCCCRHRSLRLRFGHLITTAFAVT